MAQGMHILMRWRVLRTATSAVRLYACHIAKLAGRILSQVHVDDVLRAIALQSANVDLILDFEALVLLPPDAQSITNLMAVVTDALKGIEGRILRNIVVCASSIPEQVGQRYNWNPLEVPRTELYAWIELLSRTQALTLKFGDYGVIYAHGGDSKVPRQPPSRVRFSTETHHLLCRAPAGEYRKLCAAVIASEAFNSEYPAWGATTIHSCGIGSGSEGNPTDWVSRDMNLHIESTAQHVEQVLGRAGRLAPLEFAKPEKTPWLQPNFEGLLG